VLEYSYSALLQAHFLRTPSVPRIWCSNLLVGYEELDRLIATRLAGGSTHEAAHQRTDPRRR
jgi:hypothetical protein